MIIISQDKDNIVNFNNIVSIGINDFEASNTWQRITAKTLGTAVVLGDYKTEKRAKEVLNEISIAYANMEFIKMPKIEIQKETTPIELLRNMCYRMPQK